MKAKERRREYLAKAREAEKQAELTGERHEKGSWFRIAECYRELARHQGGVRETDD